jgi:hypothetical protein
VAPEELSVLFNCHWTDLNKRMLVMVILPMSFVTMPVALVVVMPIFIIPIAVPLILISLG